MYLFKRSKIRVMHCKNHWFTVHSSSSLKKPTLIRDHDEHRTHQKWKLTLNTITLHLQKMSMMVVGYIFYPSTLKQFHGKIFQSFQSTWQGSGTYTTTKVVSTWIRSQALPKHLWRTNARRTLPAASFPSSAELHRTGSIYNTHVIVIFDMLRV